MKLATRTTLIAALICLCLSIALGLWLKSKFDQSMREVANQTTLFLGRQVQALLHGPFFEALDSFEERQDFASSLEIAVDRSIALVSMEVVNNNGAVVASGNKSSVGKRRPPPGEMFGDVREVKVLDIDADFTLHRRTKMVVPFVHDGDLKGYLYLELQHRQIEQLYGSFYANVATVALCALFAVLAFGGLLHLQLRRLGSALALAVEANMEDADATPLESIDGEFAGVQEAAKRFGAKLRAARGEAQSARRELNTLAKATSVGVLLFDSEHELVYVTDVAAELISSDNGDDLKDSIASLREILVAIRETNADSFQIPAIREVRLPTNVGRLLRIEFHAIGETEWGGCLVVVKDREVAEALETDLRAATRLRALNTLFLGATHDIRSPLNAITINLELLKRTLQQEEEQNTKLLQYINVIRTEMERLQRRLSAVIGHAAPPTDEEVESDAALVISGLIELLKPQATAQRIELDTQLPDEPAIVAIPPSQLHQAVMNILVNAIEAMPDGGTLLVELTQSSNGMRLRVKDSGPGIPAPLIHKVFDMHFTTKSTGTGVGLYVVREIIERHGGTIRLNSELGAGVDIEVRFPDEERSDPIADVSVGSSSPHAARLDRA